LLPSPSLTVISIAVIAIAIVAIAIISITAIAITIIHGLLVVVMSGQFLCENDAETSQKD